MFQPSHHRETDIGRQHALIRDNPLGLLVTVGSDGPEANPIPFVLDTDRGPFGRLRGHLARANDQWRSFDPSFDALVVFQGPDAYVTPSWYVTKAETGKVVPTWNYAVVQVRGPLCVIDDRAWLSDQIGALTRQQEESRREPWQVSDAPERFVEAMKNGIVGVEIEIRRIEGKWKVSQNRPAADRAGVVNGLRTEGGSDDLAMAELVQDARIEPR
ncbi:FMN-binding negative transcriptional regulator [Bauldia sp.]|uniref:FMN-binding negative transcriptional regulator n=1 Tax=Bauldia sp. TaxID=2575872 RepID=UPI003BACF267